MSEIDDVGRIDADGAQRIENVLNEVTTTSPRTRRWLLQRAAVGVAAAGALTPVGAAVAAGRKPSSKGAALIKKIGVTAATAEALAVTYLTQVVSRAPGTPVAGAAEVIKAANAEEYAHYQFLTGAGFQPLTTKFWIPNAFFGDRLANVPATIEVAETVFINAYLIAINAFAGLGQPKLARYAGEILGVEAEHRALARSLQGKLPNNRAFESYGLHSIEACVKALTDTGVGFGAQGSAPGAFFDFAPPPAAAVTTIEGTTPE